MILNRSELIAKLSNKFNSFTSSDIDYSVKKILDKLKTIATKKEKYAGFFEQYGRLIKEGVYQDFEHKEALTDLLRFKSTKEEDRQDLERHLLNFKSYINFDAILDPNEYPKTIILFISDYSSIVKFNFSLFARCSSTISSLD